MRVTLTKAQNRLHKMTVESKKIIILFVTKVINNITEYAKKLTT